MRTQYHIAHLIMKMGRNARRIFLNRMGKWSDPFNSY